MDEEGKSKIDGLDEKLYSRARYRDPLDKRSPVKEMELPEVETKWGTPELDEMLTHERIIAPVNPVMKKIFVGALLFFLATIGLAFFVFIGGANFVSSKNVDINVLGPSTIQAGEVLDLGVSISNSNNADLELANLSIQYPQGSRTAEDTTKLLTYTKDDLGVISTGAETIRNEHVVLFGLPGEIKEIKFSVEYKVKGSNATFYKDKIFEITIGDSPVTLTVESPPKTNSGSTFTTVISVTSNSTDILKNVVLKAEYPHGYGALSATPEPLPDSSIWVLGDLTPKSKKIITLRGVITGEDTEERTFRFYVGISNGDGANPDLGITIASFSNTIAINRPSIGLSIFFNGENTPVYIAPDARLISTLIDFKNNLSEKLFNPRLEIKISGTALDKASITADNDGLYDAPSSKIVWNLLNNLGLPELAPGEGGKVTLRFSSLPSLSLPAGSKDIKLSFSLTAVQVNDDGQRSVAVSESRTVKISTQVNLASKVLSTLGPFANHGPIPPKVKEETTYTIVFNVGNTQGDLVDAKVTAKLGRSVGWLGASSFASGGVSYNPSNRTVTWTLGPLSSGTGFSSVTREQAFQISLTPTLDQIGTVPSLLTDILFSGRDTVSGEMVNASNPPLTTRMVSDPAFIQGDDIVGK